MSIREAHFIDLGVFERPGERWEGGAVGARKFKEVRFATGGDWGSGKFIQSQAAGLFESWLSERKSKPRVLTREDRYVMRGRE